ncbi:MAG: hypothetical protein GXO79_12710 [Chlorobi bacterium]|nr:hypothetical protein [Chlorobiota bacterium]
MRKITFIVICLSFLASCLPDEEIIPGSNDLRDKITGTWNCAENSPTYGELNYIVKIYKDETDSLNVEVGNFYGLGEWSSVIATLSGSKLTVSLQEVEGHSISGSGTIASDYKSINWIYQVTELNKKSDEMKIEETVTAVYTR